MKQEDNATEDFIIERVYFPECEFSNAVNALKEPDITKKRFAGFYADCVISDPKAHAIDWRKLDGLIVERWGHHALLWIKKQARAQLMAARMMLEQRRANAAGRSEGK